MMIRTDDSSLTKTVVNRGLTVVEVVGSKESRLSHLHYPTDSKPVPRCEALRGSVCTDYLTESVFSRSLIDAMTTTARAVFDALGIVVEGSRGKGHSAFYQWIVVKRELVGAWVPLYDMMRVRSDIASFI